MRKVGVVALVLLVLVGSVGCFGHQKFTRQFDDWLNQGYVDSPWLVGNVVSGALIGIGFGLIGFVDAFVNFYYFWFEDAWPLGSGEGTGFIHEVPVLPK